MTVRDLIIKEGRVRLTLPILEAETANEAESAKLINRTTEGIAEEITTHVKSDPTIIRYTVTHKTDTKSKALTITLYLSTIKRSTTTGTKTTKRPLTLKWTNTHLSIEHP